MHGRTWIYDIADDQNGKLEKKRCAHPRFGGKLMFLKHLLYIELMLKLTNWKPQMGNDHATCTSMFRPKTSIPYI